MGRPIRIGNRMAARVLTQVPELQQSTTGVQTAAPGSSFVTLSRRKDSSRCVIVHDPPSFRKFLQHQREQSSLFLPR